MINTKKLNYILISIVKRGGLENVSCREYYCYKLQIREIEESIILMAGRLFQ